MAGSLKLDGSQFLVKEGGQFKITNSELKLKSSGNTVVDSSGNAVISESGGTVTLNKGTLGSAVVLGTTSSPIANHLVFADGKGIDFSSAAGSASGSSSAVLDDYEEGTWTPRMKIDGTGTEFTASTREGTYTKIGRLVNLTCKYYYTGRGSAGSYAFMSGAPFLSSSSTTSEFSVYILQGSVDTSSYSARFVSTTFLGFHKNNDANNSGVGWMMESNFPSSGTLHFTMSFVTA